MNAYCDTVSIEARQALARQRAKRMSDYTIDNCPFCGEAFETPMVAKYYGEEDCESLCQHNEDSVDARYLLHASA